MSYRTIQMSPSKRVALTAHDNRKAALLDWARYNRGTLSQHELYATGTTGSLLANELGLDVTRFLSGPSEATSKSAQASSKAAATSSCSSGIRSNRNLTTSMRKRYCEWPWSTTFRSRAIEPPRTFCSHRRSCIATTSGCGEPEKLRLVASEFAY